MFQKYHLLQSVSGQLQQVKIKIIVAITFNAENIASS